MDAATQTHPVKLGCSPILIANYFVRKSLTEGPSISPLKLIKMVYIAHGWTLALKDEPLIDTGPQAWRYGPVIAPIYYAFKTYGAGAIDQYHQERPLDVAFERIPAEHIEILDIIWDHYSQYSEGQLSALTHQEDTPWYEVWHRQEDHQGRGAVIPTKLLQAHYSRLLKKSQRGTGTKG